MTLLEALRLGRALIKRKGWPQFYDCVNNGGRIECSVSDALADDWEVEEPKVAITRTQLVEAIRAVKDEADRHNFVLSGKELDPVEVRLARKLGLETP